MFRQSDIWDRAVSCDSESRRNTDLQHRAAFELLRDMWIAVANEMPFLSERELTEQVEIVEGIGEGLCGRRSDRDVRRQRAWAASLH